MRQRELSEKNSERTRARESFPRPNSIKPDIYKNYIPSQRYSRQSCILYDCSFVCQKSKFYSIYWRGRHTRREKHNIYKRADEHLYYGTSQAKYKRQSARPWECWLTFFIHLLIYTYFPPRLSITFSLGVRATNYDEVDVYEQEKARLWWLAGEALSYMFISLTFKVFIYSYIHDRLSLALAVFLFLNPKLDFIK